MRRSVLSVPLMLVALAAISVVDAKTVVEFTDGRYLEVRAHEVMESWVRLEVHRESTIFVPARRIQMIQRDDREIYRPAEKVVAVAQPQAAEDEPTFVLRQHPHPAISAGSLPRPRRIPIGR